MSKSKQNAAKDLSSPAIDAVIQTVEEGSPVTSVRALDSLLVESYIDSTGCRAYSRIPDIALLRREHLLRDRLGALSESGIAPLALDSAFQPLSIPDAQVLSDSMNDDQVISSIRDRYRQSRSEVLADVERDFGRLDALRSDMIEFYSAQARRARRTAPIVDNQNSASNGNTSSIEADR